MGRSIVEVMECPECGHSGFAPDGISQCVCCGGIGEVSREIFPAASEWRPIGEKTPILTRILLLRDGGIWATSLVDHDAVADAAEAGYTHFALINPPKEVEHGEADVEITIRPHVCAAEEPELTEEELLALWRIYVNREELSSRSWSWLNKASLFNRAAVRAKIREGK